MQTLACYPKRPARTAGLSRGAAPVSTRDMVSRARASVRTENAESEARTPFLLVMNRLAPGSAF